MDVVGIFNEQSNVYVHGNSWVVPCDIYFRLLVSFECSYFLNYCLSRAKLRP